MTKLSDKEKKFLKRFELTAQKRVHQYIGAGIAFFNSLILFALYIWSKHQMALMYSLFFLFIGIGVLLLSIMFSKLNSILKKMKDYINELEQGRKQ